MSSSSAGAVCGDVRRFAVLEWLENEFFRRGSNVPDFEKSEESFALLYARMEKVYDDFKPNFVVFHHKQKAVETEARQLVVENLCHATKEYEIESIFV